MWRELGFWINRKETNDLEGGRRLWNKRQGKRREDCGRGGGFHPFSITLSQVSFKLGPPWMSRPKDQQPFTLTFTRTCNLDQPIRLYPPLCWFLGGGWRTWQLHRERPLAPRGFILLWSTSDNHCTSVQPRWVLQFLSFIVIVTGVQANIHQPGSGNAVRSHVSVHHWESGVLLWVRDSLSIVWESLW